MLKFTGASLALILLAGAASAQEPQEPQRKPDPLETNLVQQWQAAQTGQQNVGDAMSKLVEAYRRERARADAAEAKLKELPAK